MTTPIEEGSINPMDCFLPEDRAPRASGNSIFSNIEETEKEDNNNDDDDDDDDDSIDLDASMNLFQDEPTPPSMLHTSLSLAAATATPITPNAAAVAAAETTNDFVRQKTIRFADQIETTIGEDNDNNNTNNNNNNTRPPLTSDASLHLSTLFGGEASSRNLDTSTNNNTIDGEEKKQEEGREGKDEEEEERDPEKEAEDAIKQNLMWTVGGMGVFALVSFVVKKIISCFSKARGDTDVGGDVANVTTDAVSNANDAMGLVVGGGGDGGASAVSSATAQAAAEASFHASTNLTQSQMALAGMAAGGDGGAGAMSVVQ